MRNFGNSGNLKRAHFKGVLPKSEHLEHAFQHRERRDSQRWIGFHCVPLAGLKARLYGSQDGRLYSIKPITFTAKLRGSTIGTMQSRRQFLSDSLKGGATLAVMPFGTLVTNRHRCVSLGNLHHGSFTPHLHTMFHVDTAKTSVPLLLVEVSGEKTASGENYSLRFRGLAKSALPQGTYRFEHEKIGSFDLFIVPGEKTAVAQYYRAIINRI